MASAFESWIGQPVIVHLALGQRKVSLRGVVTKEQPGTLLMRVQFGPDLEVNKTNVLAVEEAGMRSVTLRATAT